MPNFPKKTGKYDTYKGSTRLPQQLEQDKEYRGNMILIKDRHTDPSLTISPKSYGKYDTYKGSTLPNNSCNFCISSGNMILIKDRHSRATSLTVPSRSGNMILIKDRHSMTQFFLQE